MLNTIVSIIAKTKKMLSSKQIYILFTLAILVMASLVLQLYMTLEGAFIKEYQRFSKRENTIITKTARADESTIETKTEPQPEVKSQPATGAKSKPQPKPQAQIKAKPVAKAKGEVSGNCEQYRAIVQKYFGDMTDQALFTSTKESGCTMGGKVSPTLDYCMFQINREPLTHKNTELCVRRAYEKYVDGRVGSNNFSAWYAVCTPGNNPQPKYEGIKCQ